MFRSTAILLFTAGSLCSSLAGLSTQDPVDELLQRLSPEQKAGQLFVSWSLSRDEGANHERLLEAVRDVGLGGVILSLGTIDDAAGLVPRLQAAATVPLLLAGDFEGGVWFRLDGATPLGNQMLVGASESVALAEAMGRITGEEARALGFHWVLAPVLDVNSNPENPIINVRSFGEDPELVGRLGAAFARGVRAAGLLPCGKHFPGHGDVDTDSHLALPTVPGDRERLRRIELAPFRAAAADGLESVMTGHLAVPGLGEAPDLPATLSPLVLQQVLRGELGFTGLVVTDALDMGGVRNALAPGEVAVQALLAGADVLLMPPDPLAARQAVLDALATGRIPAARLDGAVRRILAAKARVGLLDGGGRVVDGWRRQVRTAEADAMAQRIAARGLVLVRDRDAVLPLGDEAGERTVHVALLDKDEGQALAFAAALGGHGLQSLRLTADSDAEAVAEVVHAVAAAETVVLSLGVKVRSYSGGIGLPPAHRPVLAALRADQRVVAVSFGNPYLIRHMPQVGCFLAAFVSTWNVERAAVDALRGRSALTGRLPVAIPGVAIAGDGLTQLPGLDLRRAEPAEEDLHPALPEQLRVLLTEGVAAGAFPGAVCAVARRGAIVAEVAVGRLGYDPEAADVTLATRYDLASLTKVAATLPAVLRLAAAGKLALDDPVQKWVPAFAGADKAAVTIRHLLAHQGGLAAHRRFGETLDGWDAIVAAAAAEPLQHPPGGGAVYSDLGFILLGAVVAAAAGEPFDAYVARAVLQPLGMRGAGFAPTDRPSIDAAPTERDERRGGIVCGFVHDENAFAMGGISGHAGLFGTVGDVLRVGVLLLAGGRTLLPRNLVDAAIRPSGYGGDATRGLGVQLLQPGGFGGTQVPLGTFGHTGFTGTSLWCCPRHDLCVVLLTNRVHPTRDNDRITAVRRAVHDLVLGALQ